MNDLNKKDYQLNITLYHYQLSLFSSQNCTRVLIKFLELLYLFSFYWSFTSASFHTSLSMGGSHALLNSSPSATVQNCRRKQIISKSDSNSDNCHTTIILKNKPVSCSNLSLVSSSYSSLRNVDDPIHLSSALEFFATPILSHFQQLLFVAYHILPYNPHLKCVIYRGD